MRNCLWVAALSCLWLLGAAAASGDETYDLSVTQPSSTARLTKVVVEATGKLKLNSDGSQITELPLRVRGELQYAERTVDLTKRGRKDVRFYQTAEATIQVGDARLQNSLNGGRRLVFAQFEESEQNLFSPLGPLTRDDLELINIQGSTTLSHLLTPSAPLEIGAQWKHETGFLAPFLGLDVISQSEVKSTLRTVEGEIAIVDMSGTVSGAVDGVASDIVVKGKYNIDMASHSLTWLALSVREDRAIGHATPGFEVTARLRIAVTDQATPPELADDSLAGLPRQANAGATLLSLASSGGGFQFLHSRDWNVMVERADVTILRFIDRGDLIAQCNLSSLPDSAGGDRVALDAFRADIEKTLGENFGEFIEASQQTSSQGLRVLRAVVSGVASELPIQWIYYHVSNDVGRQAALVFTMDGKVVEKFAGADDAIVDSFEFAERVRPSGDPTPASIDKPEADPSIR